VKIKFQADADFNEDIVKGVLRREPAVDFRTAAAAGLRSLTDLEVLSIAARDGRALISHDRRTMPRAFAEFVQTNKSPGVLIISQKADLLSVIDDLLVVWMATDAEEWTNYLGAIPF
jgi:hypothetical protein